MNAAKIIRVIFLVFLLPFGAIASPRKTISIRERLVDGAWTRHLDEMILFANGTYESHDRSEDKPAHGKWRLDGKTLIMTEDGKTVKHRIISVTATDLEMTFPNSSEGLHYRRFSE